MKLWSRWWDNLIKRLDAKILTEVCQYLMAESVALRVYGFSLERMWSEKNGSLHWVYVGDYLRVEIVDWFGDTDLRIGERIFDSSRDKSITLLMNQEDIPSRNLPLKIRILALMDAILEYYPSG